MKTTLIAVTLLSVFVCSSASANTYAVTTNTTWTALVGGGSCWTCTFNITPGITLTWDASVTCGTCTFNNGNIAITQNITCQGCTFNTETITTSNVELNFQSSTTTFSNTNFAISGTGFILVTAGLSLSNSTFNFSGSSYLNMNGGAFTASSSILDFVGNSYLTATSGPISLENSSNLVVGDGTSGSMAYIYLNGPATNIYDNSLIKLSGQNNSYFANGKAYSYYATTASPTATSVATKNTNLNCNTGATTGYPNNCSTNYIYGCATMNSGGALACTPLAITGANLSATLSGNHSVELSWAPGQSIDPDHFIVQRNTNKEGWQTIGTVTAQSYTDLSGNYHFNDPSAPAGDDSYRLQVVNENGAAAWSTIATVTIAAVASGGCSIYPNPIIGQSFFLKTPSADQVIIKTFTLSGQLLSLVSLKGQTQYQVGLPSGVPRHSTIVIQVIGETGSQAFTVFSE